MQFFSLFLQCLRIICYAVLNRENIMLPHQRPELRQWIHLFWCCNISIPLHTVQTYQVLYHMTYLHKFVAKYRGQIPPPHVAQGPPVKKADP